MTCVGKNKNVWINPHEMKMPKIAPDLRVGLDGEPPLLLTLSHLGLQGVEKDGEEVKDVVEVDDETEDDDDDDALDSGSKKRMKSFFRAFLFRQRFSPAKREKREKNFGATSGGKKYQNQKIGPEKKQSRIKL